MIWWHPELQNSVFQFRWDFKLSPVLVGVLASSMMRGRERENITGFVFFGSRRILQAGGFQSFESLFGVFLLLFCPSCLEKETLFLLLQVEKHHPETKNCILIAATKVTPPGDPKKASLLLQTQETPPRDKKKTASLLLQIQETPPRDQKKNCILVAANSWNTTQRQKLHSCCCNSRNNTQRLTENYWKLSMWTRSFMHPRRERHWKILQSELEQQWPVNNIVLMGWHPLHTALSIGAARIFQPVNHSSHVFVDFVEVYQNPPYIQFLEASKFTVHLGSDVYHGSTDW